MSEHKAIRFTDFEVIAVENGFILSEFEVGRVVERQWVFTSRDTLALWIKHNMARASFESDIGAPVEPNA